jgi:putative tricarboxylic transport membrane protein
MQENDYPVAPLILGMVIGPIIEQSFMQAMIAQNGSLAAFFSRPLAAGLGILTIFLWISPVVAMIRAHRRRRSRAAEASHA